MTKGKCTICSLNDQTLCDINYTIKQHATTVLGITEFQLKSQNINICLRCQFNLELAFKINKHVALFFKHGAKLTTECILCRRSSLYLLNVTETKENTESFVHKIAKCTEQENITLTGQQKVCYRCLYFTDVWFDLRSGFEGEISEESYIDNNNSSTMRRSAMKKTPFISNNSKKKQNKLEIKKLSIDMNGIETTNVSRLRAKPSLLLTKIDTSKVKSPKKILPASKIIKKRRLVFREKFDEKLMNRVCLIDVSYNTDPKKPKRRGKIQFNISENIKSPQTPKARTKVVSVPLPVKSDTPVSKRATRNAVVNNEKDTSSPIKSKKISAPVVELKIKHSKPQPKKSTLKQKESQPPLPSVQKPAPKSKKKPVPLPKISTPKPVLKKKSVKCSQCSKTFAYDYKLKLHEFEHTNSYSPKVEVYKSNLEQMRKLWFTADDSSDGELVTPVLKEKKEKKKIVDISTDTNTKNVSNSETDKTNDKMDDDDDIVVLPDSTPSEEPLFEHVRSKKPRHKQDEIQEVIDVPDDNAESNVNNLNDEVFNISDDEQESTEKTVQNENISSHTNDESIGTDSGDVNPEPDESGNTNPQSDEGDEKNSQQDVSDNINLQLDDSRPSQPDECGDENSQTNESEDSQTNEHGDSQTNECGDENLQTDECDDTHQSPDDAADDRNQPTTNDEENCCEVNGDSNDDRQIKTKASRDDEENSENNQNFPPKKRIRIDETCEGNETEVPNDTGNKSITIADDDNSLGETDKDVPNYNEGQMSMAEITETLQELGA